MKTVIVVAHPQLDNSTTQHFFKEGLADFFGYDWHVLSKQYDVDAERELLLSADRIVLQFPLYWYSAPALLKQWIDDVFSVTKLDLAQVELGLVVTTGDAKKEFQAGGAEGYTISEVLRPFEMLAHKLKMRYLAPLVVNQFAYLEHSEQQLLLVNYQQYITNDKFNQFDGQVDWFLEALRQRINRNPELEKIRLIIEENEEQRRELKWNLEMFKQDDD